MVRILKMLAVAAAAVFGAAQAADDLTAVRYLVIRAGAF